MLREPRVYFRSRVPLFRRASFDAVSSWTDLTLVSAERSKISLFEVDRRLHADAFEIVFEPFLGPRTA